MERTEFVVRAPALESIRSGTLAVSVSDLLGLATDLVDKVLESIGIPETLLSLVEEMILANIDPESCTPEFLVLSVGEREGEPVLVTLQRTEEGFWQILNSEDFTESHCPMTLRRRTQPVLPEEILGFSVIDVFVSRFHSFLTFVKNIAISAGSDTITAVDDVPSLAGNNLPSLGTVLRGDSMTNFQIHFNLLDWQVF